MNPSQLLTHRYLQKQRCLEVPSPDRSNTSTGCASESSRKHVSHNTKKNRGRTSKHPAPVLSDVLQVLSVKGSRILRVVVPGTQSISDVPRASPGTNLGVRGVAGGASLATEHRGVSDRSGLASSGVKLPHGILLGVCVDGLLPSTSETNIGISSSPTQP